MLIIALALTVTTDDELIGIRALLPLGTGRVRGTHWLVYLFAALFLLRTCGCQTPGHRTASNSNPINAGTPSRYMHSRGESGRGCERPRR